MKTYKAKINGKEFTRKSGHEYKTAAAWVNIHTGEVKNVTFSNGIATPSRFGVCEILTSKHRPFYKSISAFETARKQSEENAKNWQIELVNL